MDSKLKIAVIGGGAAGLMAAGRAAELGADVTVFEKNKMTGRKLLITGKGRCNVANSCDIQTFISNVPQNPRFLYTAINNFTPADSFEFFEQKGVPLKVERGNRVFPVSDKSIDIVNALRGYCNERKVRIVNERVVSIAVEDGAVNGIITNRKYSFDRVILATGGCSYPLTGSNGDGYKIAESLGICVTEIRPSLVPVEVHERYCRDLQGLSLKNVSVKAINAEGKTVYEDFGEMMFTHFGLTGPVILSMSAHLRDIGKTQYRVVIDLKPALDEKTLDKRIISDFEKYSNRNFSNALGDLLPSKLIDTFIALTGISPYQKVNEITKQQRAAIVATLKNLTFTISRMRPVDEAIITSGGISVNEINPKTMQSKKISGLYFAGEIIDVDAYTGGFNLQIAFSTARLAAEDAVNV